MKAQRILDIHSPTFVHEADTLLTMHYPRCKITRKPVLVGDRIHVGYRYKISRGLFRWEKAVAFGLT